MSTTPLVHCLLLVLFLAQAAHAGDVRLRAYSKGGEQLTERAYTTEDKQIIWLSRLVPEYTLFKANSTVKPFGTRTYKFLGYTLASRLLGLPQAGGPAEVFEPHLVEVDSTTYPFDPLTALSTAAQRMIYGRSVITPVPPSLAAMSEYLVNFTIRGEPVYDVLEALDSQHGLQYPVSIVGGTVRDLLGGKSGTEIVDIDMTISQTYSALGFALTDFFNNRGREVTDRVLLTGTSKSRFGQMKVAKMAGDQEDLDVACLKSRSFPENDPIRVNMVSPLLAPEKEMDYLFGFSYVSDARSRDYTFNSVYLEPFPKNASRLIDIYETGTQDAQQRLLRLPKHGINGAGRDIFDFDSGAWFRYWKMIGPSGKNLTAAEPEKYARLVCDLLTQDMLGAWSATFNGKCDSWTPAANKHVSAHPAYFFYKLMKKLYSLSASKLNYPTILANTTSLRDVIREQRCAECDQMWTMLIEKVNDPLTDKVLSCLLADAPEQWATSLIIRSLRELGNYSPLPSTRAASRQVRGLAARSHSVDPDPALLDKVEAYLRDLTAQADLFVPLAADSTDTTAVFANADTVGNDNEDDTPIFTQYPGFGDVKITTSDNQAIYAHQLFLVLAGVSTGNSEFDNATSPSHKAMGSSQLIAGDAANRGSIRLDLDKADAAKLVKALYADRQAVRNYAAAIAAWVNVTDKSEEAEDLRARMLATPLMTFAADPTDVQVHHLVLLSRFGKSAHNRFGVGNASCSPVSFVHLESTDFVPTTALNKFFYFVYTNTYPDGYGAADPDYAIVEELVEIARFNEKDEDNNMSQAGPVVKPTGTLLLVFATLVPFLQLLW